jgi:hypothetical protein
MRDEEWSMSYEQFYGVSAAEAQMIRNFWRAMGRRLYLITQEARDGWDVLSQVRTNNAESR